MTSRIRNRNIRSTAVFALALAGLIGGAGREALASAGCTAWNAIPPRSRGGTLVENTNSWSAGDVIQITEPLGTMNSAMIMVGSAVVASKKGGGVISYTITNADTHSQVFFDVYTRGVGIQPQAVFSCTPAGGGR